MSLLDDEDDTYGFGSFSDLFDGGSRSSSVFSTPAELASASTHPIAVARASGAKQLDVRAMSRLWVSEHALADFERQRKNRELSQGDAKEYQHVAAKFGGVTVEGGLGSAFYVQSFGVEMAGLLWIQTRQSDSNVQEKRKKELQDITNQRSNSSSYGGANKPSKESAKSSSAVFIRMADIAEATSTRIQNTVRGIAFKLRSGHQFEIAFMPGPFANTSDYHELLATVLKSKNASLTASKAISPGTKPASTRTPVERNEASGQADIDSAQGEAIVAMNNGGGSKALDAPSSRSSPKSPKAARQRGSVVSRYVSTNQTSPEVPRATSGSTDSKYGKESEAKTKEAVRAMVRTYLSLDELSDEAIQLARKVHALSGYHLGPRAKTFPSFSADPVYRKKMVSELSSFLERMNKEWKHADVERESATRTKAERGQNDVYEYTDVDIGERISTMEYQERYLTHIGGHTVNPIIHVMPVQTRVTTASYASVAAVSSAGRPTPSRATATISKATLPVGADLNSPSNLLGFDISKSCIIDDNFYEESRLSLEESRLGAGNTADRADLSEPAVVELQDAREELWKSWEKALFKYYLRRQTVLQIENNKGQSTITKLSSRAAVQTESRENIAGQSLNAISADIRKRARRRSLVQPNALRFSAGFQEAQASPTEKPVAKTTATSEKETTLTAMPSKRRRSDFEARPGGESESAVPSQAARRKVRRQSIVGVVQLGEDAEEKSEASGGTPSSKGTSPRRLQSTTSNKETEAKSEQTSDQPSLCELCYSQSALVCMNPCDHSVCITCWTRLAPASSPASEASNVARMCPWDREFVTKR